MYAGFRLVLLLKAPEFCCQLIYLVHITNFLEVALIKSSYGVVISRESQTNRVHLQWNCGGLCLPMRSKLQKTVKKGALQEAAAVRVVNPYMFLLRIFLCCWGTGRARAVAVLCDGKLSCSSQELRAAACLPSAALQILTLQWRRLFSWVYDHLSLTRWENTLLISVTSNQPLHIALQEPVSGKKKKSANLTTGL